MRSDWLLAWQAIMTLGLGISRLQLNTIADITNCSPPSPYTYHPLLSISNASPVCNSQHVLASNYWWLGLMCNRNISKVCRSAISIPKMSSMSPHLFFLQSLSAIVETTTTDRECIPSADTKSRTATPS